MVFPENLVGRIKTGSLGIAASATASTSSRSIWHDELPIPIARSPTARRGPSRSPRSSTRRPARASSSTWPRPTHPGNVAPPPPTSPSRTASGRSGAGLARCAARRSIAQPRQAATDTSLTSRTHADARDDGAPARRPTARRGHLDHPEKWVVINGFAGCPFLEITPHAGAYVFSARGAPTSPRGRALSVLFSDVMNVYATTYFCFRGATPSDYYGMGYGTRDFAACSSTATFPSTSRSPAARRSPGPRLARQDHRRRVAGVQVDRPPSRGGRAQRKLRELRRTFEEHIEKLNQDRRAPPHGRCGRVGVRARVHDRVPHEAHWRQGRRAARPREEGRGRRCSRRPASCPRISTRALPRVCRPTSASPTSASSPPMSRPSSRPRSSSLWSTRRVRCVPARVLLVQAPRDRLRRL